MGFYSYNETQYNTAQYNADTNDVLNVLTDTFPVTDDTIMKTIGAVRIETVSSNDVRIHEQEMGLIDAVFSDDVVSKSITDKGLSDTIRLAVWFKIARVPTVNNPWGD